MYDKLWLIPFFPLVGSIINGLLGKRFIKNEKIIGAIGTGAIFLSFLVSCKFFYQLVNDSVKIHETVVASWMSVGNLQVDWGFLLDPLSASHAHGGLRGWLPDPSLLHRLYAW